jgi:hypothetical protein
MVVTTHAAPPHRSQLASLFLAAAAMSATPFRHWDDEHDRGQ